MAGEHEIWMTDDIGNRLFLLDNTLSGWFNKIANGIGAFRIQLPTKTFDPSFLTPERRDYMIQDWRKPPGGSMSLFNTYFLRWWRLQRNGSDLQVEIAGPDVNDLARRRHIINFATTSGSDKSGTADDVMKEYVDEQAVTDSSDPAPTFGSRVIPDFSVQADATLGPALDKSAAWRKLADTLPDLAKASRDLSPETFWMIEVADVGPPITLQFRTKTGQPGTDLTASVVFDEERGNLERSIYTYDSLNEENYIYAGGQGRDEERVIGQGWDAARIAASRYNRCEGWAYAAFTNDTGALDDEASRQLALREPIESFSAKALDTRGTRFGRDWNWGDKVTARFLGREWQTIVRKVALRLDGSGHETIDAVLEFES
jgi:hypothetical protein